MRVVAIPGSSSKDSINKKLVAYAAGLFAGADVEVLDLNDFELPLFSVDREQEIGQPEAATRFLDKISGADVVLLSLAEHNGNMSVAFKNIFDWASRQVKQVLQDKPMLLMATSPGARGGATVLQIAALTLPRYGGNIVATFSLPRFAENFDVEKGMIANPELDRELRDAVAKLQ